MGADSFAELLREARKRSGLTQKELAERVGLDDSYISRIERGVYNPPTRDKVLNIIDALGITEKAGRVDFLLAADCLGDNDLKNLDTDGQSEEVLDIPLLFATGALHFPRPKQLEEETIIEELRHLLRSPNMSQKHRKEFIELLQSFLNWLKFRMENSGEQEEHK